MAGKKQPKATESSECKDVKEKPAPEPKTLDLGKPW